MEKRQAGVECSPAVFPEPAALSQPGETAFDDPAPGEDFEGRQFVPPGAIQTDVPQ
jgi:hypothetical protein